MPSLETSRQMRLKRRLVDAVLSMRSLETFHQMRLQRRLLGCRP